MNSPDSSRHRASHRTCSVCGRRFLLDETEYPPFCSERCKMIDLGRWLDEEISVPHEGGPEGQESSDSNHEPEG